MINLVKGLPEAVEVNGTLFYIRTDYRLWLKFGEKLQAKDAMYIDFQFILDGEKNNNVFMNPEIFEACLKFYNNPNSTPTGDEDEQKEIVSDFLEDGEYIYASFRAKYGVNLLTDKLHWHEFLALYRGLFNDYGDIVGYRCYKGDNNDMLKIKEKWALNKKVQNSPRKKAVLQVLLGDGDFSKGGE